jgi:hypothetical protein
MHHVPLLYWEGVSQAGKRKLRVIKRKYKRESRDDQTHGRYESGRISKHLGKYIDTFT